MLRLWMARLWSICAGAGLVLLLAAEGNVCPHLRSASKTDKQNSADALPAADAADAEQPGSTASANPYQSEAPSSANETPFDPAAPADPTAPQPRPQPLAWSASWPDAVPARRSWHMDRAAQTELAGRQSGVVACGPAIQSAAAPQPPLVALAPPWQSERHLAPTLSEPQDAQSRPVRDPALASVLTRTGPPG